MKNLKRRKSSNDRPDPVSNLKQCPNSIYQEIDWKRYLKTIYSSKTLQILVGISEPLKWKNRFHKINLNKF